MAKRKSARKPPPKAAKEKLMSAFECLFCSHKGAVTVKMDKKSNTGYLGCKVCNQKFETPINVLTEPIDVYSDWVDACEEANSKNPPAVYDDEGYDDREDGYNDEELDDDNEEDHGGQQYLGQRDADDDALRELNRAQKAKTAVQPKKKRRERRATPEFDDESAVESEVDEEDDKAQSSEEEEEAQASENEVSNRRAASEENDYDQQDEKDTAVEPPQKRIKRTINTLDSDEE